MTFNKEIRTTDRNELVAVLRNAGGSKLEKRYIKCPFHDDQVASGEIRQSPATSRWYYYCYTCGLAEDVWGMQAKVEGREVGDLLREASLGSLTGRPLPTPTPAPKGLPEAAPAPASGRPEQVFETIDDLIAAYQRWHPLMVLEEVNPYTDPTSGSPDIVTIRYLPEPGAKKVMAQATPTPGGWAMKGFPGDRQTPLFNRIRLLKAKRAILVEGEKCARALTELGLVDIAAVSSLGGSKQARRVNWTPLAGKAVYLWGDNDEPGRAYVQEVIGYLELLDPPCTIYRIREEELELPEHGDVVEYLAENKDDPETAIKQVLQDAELLTIAAAESLATHIDKVVAGQHTLVEFRNKPHLTNSTQAFLPGTVTIVAGEPESGKSFFVLEEAWRQHEAGTSVRILMLEDDHAFHLKRTLAQMSGEASLLDHRYAETHATWLQETFARYRHRLDSFGVVLEAAGSVERSLFDVAEWVEQKAAAGARLIIVDPVTAASTGDQSWKDDRKFMMAAKKTAEDHGCSVLLVTHPKLGKPGAPSLSGLAGGASYGRFSQTVIWIKKHKEEQTSTIQTSMTTKEEKYIRSVHVYKARNGRDGDKQTSRDLAVRLNPENLCFREIGMIR